jgi:hypothetical protein
VGEVHREQVPGHDGGHGGEPDEAGVHDADVDAMKRGAQEGPAREASSCRARDRAAWKFLTSIDQQQRADRSLTALGIGGFCTGK